jgi:hypothetical protein
MQWVPPTARRANSLLRLRHRSVPRVLRRGRNGQEDWLTCTSARPGPLSASGARAGRGARRRTAEASTNAPRFVRLFSAASFSVCRWSCGPVRSPGPRQRPHRFHSVCPRREKSRPGSHEEPPVLADKAAPGALRKLLRQAIDFWIRYAVAHNIGKARTFRRRSSITACTH